MPKSRALKQAIAEPEMKTKSKSRKELLKELHKSGEEDMVYGQEAIMRGKVKMMGAKMMMKNKDIGMEE